MKKNELIDLLKEYKPKQAKKDLRTREKKMIENEIVKIENDYVVNVTPTYQNGSKSNQVTSKVENKVMKKDSRIEELRAKIKKLDEEIELLDYELEQVNIRLGSLNRLEKEIITDCYINEMDFRTIGIETYWRIIGQTRSEKTVQRKIEEITEKILKL